MREGIGHIVVNFTAPETKLSGQRLLRQFGGKLRLAMLAGEFCVKGVFAGLVGLVEKTGFSQSRREF